jgi:hypothetical protein
MWMQKGMEVERYRKESIANPNSIPAANNFNTWTRKSDTELCSNFKRIGNTAISLQPMLGTWIIFDNDRFDLDGVKLKLQEAL